MKHGLLQFIYIILVRIFEDESEGYGPLHLKLIYQNSIVEHSTPR